MTEMTPSKRKPATSSRMVMIALAVLAVAMVVVIGCCGVVGYTALVDNPFLSNSCHNYSRSSLEGYARFRYPASATNIHEECAIWQGADIRIWFDMDPAELDTFVASTRVKTPLKAGSVMPPEFGPDTTNRTMVYGEYQGGTSDDYKGQYLWVDETDPKQYRVYLRFAEP